MNYLEGGRWLDGPKFVRWLEVRLGEDTDIAYGDRLTWLRKVTPQAFHRRLYDWRHGATADLYLLDPLLTRFGLYPTEIPDEVWVEDGPNLGHLDRCKRGHLLSEEAIINASGYRECRACRRLSNSNAKARAAT